MTGETTSRAVTGRIPRATYRIQLNESFDLEAARELVPYLSELGISHLYASPLLKARAHSTHGYDTCDYEQLNPELGTEAGLAALVRDLQERGMGLVLDIVPNHMGVDESANNWWRDVLERGAESPYAPCFDIDWMPPDPRLRGKVLLPVLEDRYQRVLEKGGIQLAFDHNAWVMRHGQSQYPLNESSIKSIHTTLDKINADPEALDALLEQQFYRLAWYRHGDAELNYRRFFNIPTLAGLRVEDQAVFQKVMARVAHWLERGWVQGLRVDHPDGLRDPEEFLRRLRALAPSAWIVVEKILIDEERLPSGWAVDGTTGYEFIHWAGGLFIDPKGEAFMTQIYQDFTGMEQDYPALLREKKRLVLDRLLASERDRLIGLLMEVAAHDWRHRDYTWQEWQEALTEMAACFPVYRNYARPEAGEASHADATHVAHALRAARRERPDLGADMFTFLADLLLLRHEGSAAREFVARFQQLSGPAMAKGGEDTAFYCYNRLIALNEVGGNPGQFGTAPQTFHQFCREHCAEASPGMLTTSTHDTKRSEDVRARLAVLSEIPAVWRQAVRRWSYLNEKHRRRGQPDRNLEYFFYQTLVGAWPLSTPRAVSSIIKSAHEARVHGQAGEVNEEVDSALREFVVAVMADSTFQTDLAEFVNALRKPACVNSLALTLLKLTVPGVPDIYQGNELWDYSLVDPDNRRPVDFALRRRMLDKARSCSAEAAWAEWESGLPKMWLIRQTLRLREKRPEWFDASADYAAMTARGWAADSVLAFQRGGGMIVVVPRLTLQTGGDWRDTVVPLPPGRWHNAFTGEVLPAGAVSMCALLHRFPVALLLRKGGE